VPEPHKLNRLLLARLTASSAVAHWFGVFVAGERAESQIGGLGRRVRCVSALCGRQNVLQELSQTLQA
jgi:hypothetical protein